MTNNFYEALELSLSDWKILFAGWGEPSFRASQLCQWIYSKKIFNYHDMSNLSKELRSKLSENVLMTMPIMFMQQKSGDGTKKFLWLLSDGNKIESVLLDH